MKSRGEALQARGGPTKIEVVVSKSSASNPSAFLVVVKLPEGISKGYLDRREKVYTPMLLLIKLQRLTKFKNFQKKTSKGI